MFTLGFKKIAVSTKWLAKHLDPKKHSERLHQHFYDKSFKSATLGFQGHPRLLDSASEKASREGMRQKAIKMRSNLNKMHAALRRKTYDTGNTKTKKAVIQHVKNEADISRKVREHMMDKFGPKGTA